MRISPFYAGTRSLKNLSADPENTTWFEDGPMSEGIYSIIDVDSALLIRETGCTIPFVGPRARTVINLDLRKARDLIKQHP